MKEIKLNGVENEEEPIINNGEGSFVFDNIFSIPILTIQVKDWNKKRKTLMKHYLRQTESNDIYLRHDEVLTSYLDMKDISKKTDEWIENNDKFVESMQELFEKEINLIYDKMLKPYDRLSNRKLKIGEFWFQNQNNGTAHGIHTHGSMGLSVVCYVKYDNQYHSPTSFISPNFNSITNTNMTWYPEESTEGTMIVFPSNILHYTQPNNSDVSRVIISFNLYG
jgi:uncharacterized protein (TIGR02466 family)